MKEIAIVGAGQSGLQLAIGLLQHGYHVTLTTDRDVHDILHGPVLSSQCMFSEALNTERRVNLNLWENEVPHLNYSEFSIANTEQPEQVHSWKTNLLDFACSVDQRLKISTLMNHFVNQGGNLMIKKVAINQLNQMTLEYDLVIIATGRGLLANIFPVNFKETVYTEPQRKLALTYVKPTHRPISETIRFTKIPDIGEFVTFPALTRSGECEIMNFEAIPNGPMDRWKPGMTLLEHLRTSLQVLKKWVPHEFDHFSAASLTDKEGYFCGAITPTVRHPVFTLPSGRMVLGMGDALVVNDPITGQGANSAAKCANIYLNAILNHAGEFDRPWMYKTFGEFWDYAQHVVRWTNSLLDPFTSKIESLLKSAKYDAELAHRIANGFDNPRSFSPWWYN